MSLGPDVAGSPPGTSARVRALSGKTLGVLAVVALVVAFSLSSTLVKRAESPGVLVAFWRMVTVSLVWNAVLWTTGRRVTLRDVRQVVVPGIFFGLNLADVSRLQWVVDAYTLVFAGLLLLAGALGDRYGRRRTLLAGLAVFGAASAGAAYAGGADALIGARAIMGAGAAFIMPATLSLLISVFTDPRERAMAVGIWAATAGLGVALGPVVGGVLLDRYWWGSIFIVNVPLCVVAIGLGRAVVQESRDPHPARIDWTGVALSGAGLIALVWAVIEAPARGWTSAAVLGAGAFAAIALAAFVAQQRRTAEPLLDLRLFRDPRFSAASATIMVLFFALFGFLFLATQYLQFVLGYSPSAAGVRVLPYAGAMILFAPLSSRLVLRFGTRRVATTGMLLFSAGLAVAATVTTGTGYGRLAVAFVLMGAGMGLAGAPATESITGALPPERANVGSAVNDTTRELGGALGVAIVGSIMSSLYATRLSDALPDGVPAPVAAAARGVAGRGRPRRRSRRRPRARGVRARDVAGVDRRRGRRRVRGAHRVAPSTRPQPGAGRRGSRFRSGSPKRGDVTAIRQADTGACTRPEERPWPSDPSSSSCWASNIRSSTARSSPSSNACGRATPSA